MKTKRTDSEVKHSIIKVKVDNAYERIKDAEKVLEECREKCEHPETELCTYSPRVGQYFENTKICSVCGDVVGFEENPQIGIWTATGRVDEDTPYIAVDDYNITEKEFKKLHSALTKRGEDD
jgi:hypothetical protein